MQPLHRTFRGFGAPIVTALLGGSQAPPSDRHIKQFYHQVCAAQVSSGDPPGWVAPKADHTFGPKDQPATMA